MIIKRHLACSLATRIVSFQPSQSTRLPDSVPQLKRVAPLIHASFIMSTRGRMDRGWKVARVERVRHEDMRDGRVARAHQARRAPAGVFDVAMMRRETRSRLDRIGARHPRVEASPFVERYSSSASECWAAWSDTRYLSVTPAPSGNKSAVLQRGGDGQPPPPG